MQIKYEKKIMNKDSIVRGRSPKELRDLEEAFWNLVDSKYEKNSRRRLYYWFDRDTGESWTGYSRKRWLETKPAYRAGGRVIY